MTKQAMETTDRPRLDAMVREASVDCYNETAQAVGLLTMMEEHLDVPFETSVLGVPVTVTSVDISDDNRIVAVSVRGQTRQAIPILDLPVPAPPGAEWVAAYRLWLDGA